MLAVLDDADFIRAWSSSRASRLISESFLSSSAFKASAGEANPSSEEGAPSLRGFCARMGETKADTTPSNS
jgi:hypothetical protein